MSDAKRDSNRVTTLLGVSNVDFITPTLISVNPSTGAMQITGSGIGTVASVSVVTANGVSGTVATATTTPAITLTLGAITPTTVNGVTFTGSGTATLALGTKSLTISNTLTLAGTDSTTMTFPTTSATIARTDAANTFTGVQTMTSPALTTPAITGISTGSGVATANTINTLVLRDGSGNFSAGTITATLSGNASTVTTNANLTGPITSVGNATTVANSINLPVNPTTTTQAQADNSTKIATTAYVDRAILGQNFKEAVKYASVAALPSIVYANGSSGVGATLTGVALAAISLDSSSPAVNDRVLIKNQASTFQNGIYTVTATGSGIAVFVLTRATDADSSVEFKTGDSVFITSGSTLSTTTWAYTGIDSPTMGTDAITYAQVAGQGSFTAGNGITITGVSIAIDTSITVDKTTAQTLSSKTLTAPIINGLTSASGNMDFSGSSGTFLTSTGANTLSGAVTITDATTPSLTTASGKTNTGFVQINGKTSGSLKIITADATAQAVTLTVAAQTVGAATLTIPNMANVNKTVAWLESPSFTTPTLGAATATTINKITLTAPTTAATITFGTDNTTQTFQGTDTIVGRATTDTLTNKRVTKRVSALSANSATPAINTDTTDVVHITAQTAAITSFTTNLTGTPVDGDTLRISVTGTAAVALTFGASFEASTVALPTTTVTTARLDMGFFWNTETTKWRIMSSS